MPVVYKAAVLCPPDSETVALFAVVLHLGLSGFFFLHLFGINIRQHILFILFNTD